MEKAKASSRRERFLLSNGIKLSMVGLAALSLHQIVGMMVSSQSIKNLSISSNSGEADPSSLFDHSDQSSYIAPKLADDCYHIFLDVGANIGIHNRFLFEPHLYPKSSSARHFQSELGAFDNRDMCAFAFEPNPVHKHRLEKLSQAYQAVGWRLYILNAGASNVNGTMSFYHFDTDGSNNEWGFSAVPVPNRPGLAEEVPIIRLADFIRQHVQGRKLPATTYGGPYEKPKVLMKMDIEGMEYAVIPDLVASGALCETVDCITYEFHHSKSEFRHSISETAMKDVKSMIQSVEMNPNCITRFMLLDDESYLFDGEPFPKSNSTI
jgi:FkbM family methyltransferase